MSQGNAHLLPSHSEKALRFSYTPRFIFVVYGFELFVRVCLVSIVFALVVACFLGSVFSLILTTPLSISVCVCYLPDHRVADGGCPLLIFTSFPFHHSLSVTSPSPGSRLFFILLEMNNPDASPLPISLVTLSGSTPVAGELLTKIRLCRLMDLTVEVSGVETSSW